MTRILPHAFALSYALSAPVAAGDCVPGPAPEGLGYTLAAYYACDAEARVRILEPGEARRCVGLYAAVKSAFAPGGTSVDGYLAFKCWEAAKPGRAATLRPGLSARIDG